MLSDRSMGGGGDGGGSNGPTNPPRCSVALTAKQWSAVTLAASHGIEELKASKRIPLAIVSEALRDLGAALQEIQTRLKAEAERRSTR